MLIPIIQETSKRKPVAKKPSEGNNGNEHPSPQAMTMSKKLSKSKTCTLNAQKEKCPSEGKAMTK